MKRLKELLKHNNYASTCITCRTRHASVKIIIICESKTETHKGIFMLSCRPCIEKSKRKLVKRMEKMGLTLISIKIEPYSFISAEYHAKKFELTHECLKENGFYD